MSKAEKIARLRKATGLGWLEARTFLLGKPAALCERIVRAKECQDHRLLYDPIEDDPSFSRQFSDARQKADEALRAWITHRNEDCRRRGLDHMVSEHPLGSCYIVWHEMKKILKEEYEIEWFSPAEMNPGSRFD